MKGELEDRGCFESIDEIDVAACVAAIEEGGEDVWGIAANLMAIVCGDTDPREIMSRTLAIAERSGKPILYGARREPSDWPLAEQLRLLRPGDVVTYCFHGDAQSIVADGHVVDSAWEARANTPPRGRQRGADALAVSAWPWGPASTCGIT